MTTSFKSCVPAVLVDLLGLPSIVVSVLLGNIAGLGEPGRGGLEGCDVSMMVRMGDVDDHGVDIVSTFNMVVCGDGVIKVVRVMMSMMVMILGMMVTVMVVMIVIVMVLPVVMMVMVMMSDKEARRLLVA